MVTTLISRAKGALCGLAIGDALGSPTEGKTRSEITLRWGRVNDFLSHDQSGTDDTEYALLTSRILLHYGISFTSEDVVREYRECVLNESNKYKGAGFSEIFFLQNLRQGLSAPSSGRHIHSWSDGSAMRAAPHGIVAAGNAELAGILARREGEVTHSGEGVYCGMAVAAAISAAVNGAGLDKIQNAALDVVPHDTWTYRSLKSGIEIGKASSDVWQALDALEASLVRAFYHWPDIAPEPVGIAFGIVAASRGSFSDAVLGGVNMGRDADTIAAIAGAITGAMSGYEKLPEAWKKRISVAEGNCIKTVAGMDIAGTAESLAKMANHE